MQEQRPISSWDHPNVDHPNVDHPNVDHPNVDHPDVDHPDVDGPNVDGPKLDQKPADEGAGLAPAVESRPLSPTRPRVSRPDLESKPRRTIESRIPRSGSAIRDYRRQAARPTTGPRSSPRCYPRRSP